MRNGKKAGKKEGRLKKLGRGEGRTVGKGKSRGTAIHTRAHFQRSWCACSPNFPLLAAVNRFDRNSILDTAY